MISEFNYKEAKELLEELDKMAKLISEAKKSITSKCTCPKEALVKKEFYFSGSYNDQAYTDYYEECSICFKRHNETSKDHSWYG